MCEIQLGQTTGNTADVTLLKLCGLDENFLSNFNLGLILYCRLCQLRLFKDYLSFFSNAAELLIDDLLKLSI